jgi:hypothetical protein
MSEIDEILEAIEDKRPEKKPSNHIWLAILFSDLVFFALDFGSGLGVYWLTKVWYYGLVVFLAGIVPLILHQKLYTRPYASPEQKTASMVGIVLSILSVLVVAVLLAAVRFMVTESMWIIEAALAVSLVALAFSHACITFYYYYKDEEIREEQKTTQMIARGARNIRRIETAHKVANAKRAEVAKKHEFEGKFSPEVLAKILQQIDSDGDGIPDFLDPVDNRKVRTFASKVDKVDFTKPSDR